MSVKKEPSGKRSVQVETEVPGTPEEVWKAISTGPGVSSWFVPAEMEQRLGGAMKLHFGPGMDSTATITAWEPPFHFAAESPDLGEKAPHLATEWFVEARSGGVCVVRVVHSLFSSTDDWDDQLEGTESGWPSFFRVLRLYMTHFRGMSGKTFLLMGASTQTDVETWNKLTAVLGLSDAAVGQHRTTSSGAPPLSGLVEWSGDALRPHSLLIRMDAPAPGLALLGVHNHQGMILISIGIYLYGSNAEEAAGKHQPVWEEWMKQQFPSDGTAPC